MVVRRKFWDGNVEKSGCPSLMAVTLVFVSFANTVHITFAEGNTAKLAIIGESQRALCYVRKKSKLKMGNSFKFAAKGHGGQSRI